jgi:uncharacterized protein (TIGR03435 family)
LTGQYTFILQYRDASAAQYSGTPPRDSRDAQPSDPGGAPSLIDALPKQLGLRLNKVAAIPLDVIVIYSIDRTPTEN